MNNLKTVSLTGKQILQVINAHNESHLEMIAEMYKQQHGGEANELLEIIAMYNKTLARISRQLVDEDGGDAFVQTIIDSFDEIDSINKADLN